MSVVTDALIDTAPPARAAKFAVNVAFEMEAWAESLIIIAPPDRVAELRSKVQLAILATVARVETARDPPVSAVFRENWQFDI